MSLPFIRVLKQALPYHYDQTAIFENLCKNKPHTLLLESAEISSKNSLKSLLIIDPAVKIICENQQVRFIALSINGESILPLIAQKLSHTTQIITQTASELCLSFPILDLNKDEDSKLLSSTIFDGLRCTAQLYQHSITPILLGGLFAYDLIMHFIPMHNITLNDDGLYCPDYVFYLAEQLLITDHQSQTAELHTFCFNPFVQENLQQQAAQIQQSLQKITPISPLVSVQNSHTIKTNLTDDTFKQMIQSLKHHINIGDVFQIVPSRRFELTCYDPLSAYRQLKLTNPSPYMVYLQDVDFTLFCTSPESALKYSPHSRQVEIYPIAGSRPRGFDQAGNIDPELDARLELELRLDKKELAEHLMLVDLARNDIARVSEAGTRQLKALMQVDRYSHIMHLVSRVVGKLRPEFDALHAYQACMNMGTLTGAPKIKAMQLLYQFEGQKRHSYGGAVGYLTSDGNFDTCIVIRSAFVQQNKAYIQTGCGTVLDSDPQSEADETRHKANAVIRAILQTNQQ